MSYNKRTWANGNVVGAVDLNRMEQGVESGQNGYECIEEWTTLTEETVTTTYDSEMQVNSGTLAYSQLITADKLRVTFNGTAYECDVDIAEGIFGDFYRYGGIGKDGPDFSEYPFAIVSAPVPEGTTPATNTLFAQSADTYTIKIEAVNISVEISDDFKRAVKFVSGGSLLIEGGNALNDTLNHTFTEIKNAMASGNGVIFHFVPTQSTELAEFYTQNIRVVNSSSVRQVIVQYDSSEEVTYTASSDDAYPSIRLS